VNYLSPPNGDLRKNTNVVNKINFFRSEKIEVIQVQCRVVVVCAIFVLIIQAFETPFKGKI